MKFITNILFGLLLITFCSFSEDTISISRNFTHYRIKKNYSAAVDSNSLWSRKGIEICRQYLKFNTISKSYLKHQNAYPIIIKLILQNTDSTEISCILDINNVEIDQIQLLQLDQNDSVMYLSKKLGDRYLFSERIIPYRVIAIPLKLKPKTTHSIYIGLHNKNRIITCFLDLNIENFWNNKTRESNLVNGIITGLYSCFVFFGIILFIILRRKVYLFYSLYALSICLLLLTMKGYSFEYFFPNSTWIQSRFLLVVQLAGLMSLNLYAIEFLQIEQKISFLSKAFRPIILIFGIMLLLIIVEFGRRFDIENHLSLLLYLVEGINFLLLLILGPIIYYKYRLQSALVFSISFSFVGFSLLYSTLSFLIPDLPYVLLMDSLSVTLFIEISILTIFMVFNYRKEINEKIFLQKKLLAKTKENQMAFLEGQELEKKSIAQELHDGVGTDLLILQTLLEKEKTENTNALNNILKNISNQMRQISHSMFPEVLSELGITEGLVSLFKPWEGKLKTHLFFNEQNYCLSKNEEIQIYRIVQELLKNTIKHAKAENIYLQLLKHDDEIILEYEDDGLGFDFGTKQIGVGIKSIILRAESINAEINFESNIAKGTLFAMKIKTK